MWSADPALAPADPARWLHAATCPAKQYIKEFLLDVCTAISCERIGSEILYEKGCCLAKVGAALHTMMPEEACEDSDRNLNDVPDVKTRTPTIDSDEKACEITDACNVQKDH